MKAGLYPVKGVTMAVIYFFINLVKLNEYMRHKEICQDYPIICNKCNFQIKRMHFKDHSIE